MPEVSDIVSESAHRDTDFPLFDLTGVLVHEGDTVEVEWEISFKDGEQVKDLRPDTVIVRDKGTKYERWGLASCHDHLRGMGFRLL
jgi:hypothetical protein